MNEMQRLLLGFTGPKTVTISSKDSFLKTTFVFLLVQEVLAKGIPVDYLDLDLQFSSLISNINLKSDYYGKLSLLQPSQESLEETIIDLLSRTEVANGGIILLDSINTFQHLLRKKYGRDDSTKSNHQAAIFVTLLQQFARRNSKIFFMTNISRSRPRSSDGRVKWGKEIVGGRMVKFKSDFILTLNEIEHVPQITDSSKSIMRRFEAIVSDSQRRSEGSLSGNYNFELPFLF